MALKNVKSEINDKNNVDDENKVPGIWKIIFKMWHTDELGGSGWKRIPGPMVRGTYGEFLNAHTQSCSKGIFSFDTEYGFVTAEMAAYHEDLDKTIEFDDYVKEIMQEDVQKEEDFFEKLKKEKQELLSGLYGKWTQVLCESAAMEGWPFWHVLSKETVCGTYSEYLSTPTFDKNQLPPFCEGRMTATFKEGDFIAMDLNHSFDISVKDGDKNI